jgi:asparagine synthase (glutamine-hydrolysing)
MNTTRRALQFLQPDVREAAMAWNAKAALQAVLPAGIGDWPAQNRDQYVEAQTLMSGYLLSSQGDRMAMAASVEVRFPFLDPRVIEFGNRLPPQYKRRGLREKRILKKAMADHLPAGILTRVKQPYRSPDSSSFFEGGRPLDYVSDLLDPGRVQAAGLFDAPAVGRLLEKCRAGKAVGFGDNMAFVGILSTMLLHDQFVARRPTAA